MKAAFVLGPCTIIMQGSYIGGPMQYYHARVHVQAVRCIITMQEYVYRRSNALPSCRSRYRRPNALSSCTSTHVGEGILFFFTSHRQRQPVRQTVDSFRFVGTRLMALILRTVIDAHLINSCANLSYGHRLLKPCAAI